MSYAINPPAVSAFAVVHPSGHTPVLTHDLARAQHLAAHMGGSVHHLYNGPALLAHAAATTMNHTQPDPAGATASGAIQHIGLCMSIANKAALHTIRMGWPVSDTDGTWWIDTAPLLDPATAGDEIVSEVHQHLAVALFAGLVKPHPQHKSWVRIVSTIGQPAGDGHASNTTTTEQVPK
jgi:hypothetical protein